MTTSIQCFDSDAEKIFIVMEYLEGGTLHEFVKDRFENGIEIEEALYYRFAYQIANGMEFLARQSPVSSRISHNLDRKAKAISIILNNGL